MVIDDRSVNFQVLIGRRYVGSSNWTITSRGGASELLLPFMPYHLVVASKPPGANTPWSHSSFCRQLPASLHVACRGSICQAKPQENSGHSRNCQWRAVRRAEPMPKDWAEVEGRMTSRGCGRLPENAVGKRLHTAPSLSTFMP